MSINERLQLELECLLKYSKEEMIEKYIDECKENAKLSGLWCKSQQENKQLKEDFKILKTLQMNTNNILNELEEWLKDKLKQNGSYRKNDDEDMINYLMHRYYAFREIAEHIEELKEKYK